MMNNRLFDGDWWDTLSEYQKDAILEGIDDIENGRVISSEEFWKNLTLNEA